MSRDLVALAIAYHKTVEGEYGCNGASCPGVQRLVALLERVSPPGSVTLSAEDARGLAFLLARAIREDAEASDADRREARKLLERLGGETQ